MSEKIRVGNELPGHAEKEMAAADGREVWLLAEKYQIDGVKEWLMREGLDSGGVCAAAQYALEGDGEGLERLLEACQSKRGQRCISIVDEGCLRGVHARAMQEVIQGHQRAGGVLENERAMNRLRLVKGWSKVNGVHACNTGCDADDGLHDLIQAIGLTHIPADFISDIVIPSGIVSAQDLMHVDQDLMHVDQEDKGQDTGARDVGHDVGQSRIGDVRLHLVKTLGANCGSVGHISVYEGDEKVLMAVSDHPCTQLSVYDVESTDKVLTLGPEWSAYSTSSEPVTEPFGVAFGRQGHLIVSFRQSRCIWVFNREGILVRMFDSCVFGDGQKCGNLSLAVNSQGDIIVSDSANHRVQVFQEDGTFIHKFGSSGTDAGQFDSPAGVAVGPNDRIVVVDQGNNRVQVFCRSGCHLLTIGSIGRGPGQFSKPFGVCVGPQGEIIVCDWGREDVQVFSQSGQLMQCVGSGKDSDCGIAATNGIAVDSRGRLFVGNKKGGSRDIAVLWSIKTTHTP